MKKFSLRLRLTCISVSLLLLCCLGLTLVLNHAAGMMADAIEAIPVIPAYTIDQTAILSETDTVPIVTSEASQQARSHFMWQSYLYMLLIVLVGGLLTWIITGRALRPLEELSDQMRSRTVQNLADELPIPKRQDEIASLTRSFNEMNHKLNEAFSMQKRFAQSAAHELRTPLTILKAKVDVFRKKPEHTPKEYDTLLQLVGTQTDRMTALVNDLLGLTNLDALPCNQVIALQPLLTEVMQELSPMAAEKNMSLTLQASDCQTVGNLNLLYRAFANLVENAVKYTAPGGTITVSITAQPKQVFIRVTDNGPGIPDAQKDFIFEPFYRVDKSRSRQMGGAGLGLATVKAIIEKNAGQVIVEDAPGGGSSFVVTLQRLN